MSSPPRARIRSGSSTSIERVLKYNYTYESNVKPIPGTSIYESVCPHGTHVFVDLSDFPVKGRHKLPSEAAESMKSLAEESCGHTVGYVVLHPDCTIVKRVGVDPKGDMYKPEYFPGSNETRIRVVPMLTIAEIEADPATASLHADRASVSIMSSMLATAHEVMEQYDSYHVRSASSARQYFELHARTLDDSTLSARESRDAMISGSHGSHHVERISASIKSIELAHTNALRMKRHIQSLELIHKDFEDMRLGFPDV